MPAGQSRTKGYLLFSAFRFDFGLHLRIRKGFEFPRKPTSKIEN